MSNDILINLHDAKKIIDILGMQRTILKQKLDKNLQKILCKQVDTVIKLLLEAKLKEE